MTMGSTVVLVTWLGCITLLLLPCTTAVPGDIHMQQYDTLADLLRAYVEAGYKYTLILEFLAVYHGVRWSLPTLNRRLQEFNIGRQRNRTPLHLIDGAIRAELLGPNSHVGYREMQRILVQKYNYTAPRHLVRQRLLFHDPDGCERRRRRVFRRRVYRNSGPMCKLHVDGFDKLKQWAFCISGAICGFSRKMIWLEVGPTNNDPKVGKNTLQT